VIDPNDLLPANGGDGSQGFVVNGAFSSQLFGMAVDLGDFDRDGRADLISGFVPSSPTPAPPYGVALLFGQREAMPMQADGLETLPFFEGTADDELVRLAIGDSGFFSGALGWRARALGDLDGDGTEDIGFVTDGSLPGSGVNKAGVIFVVYGGDGVGERFENFMQILPEFGGNGQSGFIVRGVQGGDFVGKDVNAGDINGDDLTDLVVLSDRQYEPARLEGMAYVIYGRPGRNMPAETNFDELLDAAPQQGFAIIPPVPEGPLPGQPDFEFQGARLVPDLNGDGIEELVLCRARNQFLDTFFNGECYVVFGRSGATPFPARVDLGDLLERNGGDGTDGFVIIGREAETIGGGDAQGDRNSHAFDGVADFDGDGFNDLLVSAPTGNGIGKAYLFYGQDDWPAEVDLRAGLDAVRGQVRLTEFRRFFEPPEDRLGFGQFVGGIGDINRDGLPDIMINAEPPVTQDTGAWVIFGHPDPANEFVVEGLLPEHGGDGSGGFLIRNFGGPFGIKLGAGSAMAGGDFNGDGTGDVALGSFLANPGDRGNAGRVIVLYGRGRPDFGIPALGGWGLTLLAVVLLSLGGLRLSRLRARRRVTPRVR